MIKKIISLLEDLKAQDILDLNVEHLSDDFRALIIVTATSSRHAQAIASHLSESLKKDGDFPYTVRIQQDQEAQWILIDCQEVVIHIMQKETREFYSLERLWGFEPAKKT